MAFIEQLLLSWKGTLENIAPVVSIILILLGGIIYGFSTTQRAEQRGKWQSFALGMIVGGIIVAAITGAAVLIRDISGELLKP